VKNKTQFEPCYDSDILKSFQAGSIPYPILKTFYKNFSPKCLCFQIVQGIASCRNESDLHHPAWASDATIFGNWTFNEVIKPDIDIFNKNISN